MEYFQKLRLKRLGISDLQDFLRWSGNVLPSKSKVRGIQGVRYTSDFIYPVRYTIDNISTYAYNYREFDDDLLDAYSVGCDYVFLEENSSPSIQTNGYASIALTAFKEQGVFDINGFLTHCCNILPKMCHFPLSVVKYLLAVRSDVSYCGDIFYPVAVLVEDETYVCKSKEQLSSLLLGTYFDEVAVSMGYCKRR